MIKGNYFDYKGNTKLHCCFCGRMKLNVAEGILWVFISWVIIM